MDKFSNNSTKGVENTPKRSRWDATPVIKHDLNADGPLKKNDQTPLRTDQTPDRFSATPLKAGETPRRWDDRTPLVGQTPGYPGATPTPSNLRTPDILHMAPSKLQQIRWEKQLEQRNKPYTDEQLNMLLPGQEDGYQIVKVPESYRPQKKAQSYIGSTDTQSYQIPQVQTLKGQKIQGTSQLPPIKPEQYKIFGILLQPVVQSQLTLQQQKQRKILTLLLKIKQGNPHMRKIALRQITINAVEFGAGPLFNNILPLLMSQGLDPQQRHLLVKVIDRVLYKLDELVRPYVHKILVVIQPLLIDEDYYARVEGREIISNLAKAAGLATMIKVMRPDVDHKDQFVRNTTSRAFAVVASALGIGTILPFLKAVCNSKKSWQARHTGIKIIQQIAILMGCSILPYLKQLVDTIKHGLQDAQKKVKSITALAISSLAEASAPYGIEAFDEVLIPLYKLTTFTKDKSLGAYLKAIGFIIPLMDAKHTAKYTQSVMPAIVQQFTTNEEELRKIILKVLKQIIGCNGVEANYIRKNVLPEYFECFWKRRMAIQKRNYKQLIETTVQIAKKVGIIEIVQKIFKGLKDENEAYRKMVMEGIEKILTSQYGKDISHAPETLRNELMDAALTALHEQTSDDAVILNGFGAIINALGLRAKSYFVQIVGTINWRLNNKSIRIRQQAADLVSKIANCMKLCGEQSRLGRLGLNLNQCLREEYPQVLGSILGALKQIVVEVGMTKMTPPIKDLLPRLTPILKNRNEKVQQNCIQLVGRIADKGSEEVSPKQWMRICFDLLELLKAHKRSIRRAAVTTFGYIAKAIGPQDVLVTLLNNLKVQQRQLRICTTVAIAIVSQSCGPFTVLPALMNEYRVQQLNVQNGVLKSLAFMFEYIGQMAKDYIYAVTPLLEDALTDRDLVHRQTAAAAIKHLALGVQGFGNQDALIHLLNYVWPNIFETSPHVVNAVLQAIQSIRLSVGPGVVLMYVIQGLWHPARRVRQVYWRIYNMLYVGSQDSLVPFQPIIKDDKYNTYGQPELMMSL